MEELGTGLDEERVAYAVDELGGVDKINRDVGRAGPYQSGVKGREA